MQLQSQQKEEYRKTGYLRLPGLLPLSTITNVNALVANDQTIATNASARGGVANLTLRAHASAPQSALTSVAWSPELVQAVQELYPTAQLQAFHYRLLRKLAVGQQQEGAGLGQWHPHQDDVGFWYLENPQFIPAEMVSVAVALTPCPLEAGPIQIIPGSHVQCFPHVREGMQIRMNDQSVSHLDPEAWMPCVADPGDGLVFHGSVVHKSSPNRLTAEGDLAFMHRRDFLIAVFAAGPRQNRSVDGWFDGFDWKMPGDRRHSQLIDIPQFDEAPTVGLDPQSLVFGKTQLLPILENAARFAEVRRV